MRENVNYEALQKAVHSVTRSHNEYTSINLQQISYQYFKKSKLTSN